MERSNSLLLPVILLVVIILLAGCAPSPPPLPEEPPEPTRKVPQDESFDPLSVEEEEVIVLPESKLKSPPEGTITAGAEKEGEPVAGAAEEVLGFRVQVFATDLEFEARTVEEKALIDFEESVYLVFDSPNYKIRVGDCRSRAEANKLRQRAVELGYRDAWVVQCKVMASQR